jgi:rod shape-determining protein MreC
MLSLFKRYRELLIVGALLLYPLATYLSSGHRGREPNFADRVVLTVTSPVERVLTALIEGSRSGIDSYVSLRGAHEQRDACTAELSQARAELNAMKEAKAENERLRVLLKYEEGTVEPEIPSRVIGVNASPHFVSFRIDKGESDGVRLGMPVITALGVVGQVSRVVGGSADVMLLTDPSSRLGVVVQRSRARGTAVGAGGGTKLHLENLLKSDDVIDGDTLITSGTDGVFPKGLVVGTIEGVVREPSNMFVRARVAPSADLSRVEEVLLLPSIYALAPTTGSEAKTR